MKSASPLILAVAGIHLLWALLLTLLVHVLSECAVGYLSAEIGSNRLPVLTDYFHEYVGSSYPILGTLYLSPLTLLLLPANAVGNFQSSWLRVALCLSLSYLVMIASIYPLAMPVLQLWCLPHK